MKKLIAIIGAVAMAFGLYAEDPAPASNYYSTSFETEDDGVTEKTWDAAAAGWTTTQTDAFTLGDQVEAAALPYADGRARRNTLFKGLANNVNFLKLETGTNTLVHGVVAGQVYFDQLVKFTGYEEDPTIADGAKIAVWLSAIDADDQAEPAIEGSTNLYVTVGTGSEAKNVKVAGDFKVDQWYRVTIKSIGDVSSGLTSQLGFQLFIDGQAASIVAAERAYNDNSDSFNNTAAALYDAGQLFTAIPMNDLALATVAYQGIGGVDDIIFSQEAPDFDQYVEFEIGAVPGTEVTKVVGPNGVELTAPFKVLPGSTVQIYVKAKDGYRLDYEGEYITKTVSAAGEVSIADELAGKVIKGAVMVVNAADPTVTNIWAEAELGTVLTGLVNGDTATVLEDCSALEGAYAFTPGTTITVPTANKWVVYVPSYIVEEAETGSLTDYLGLAAGKEVEISFESAESWLALGGEVLGNIDATDGSVYLDYAITVGDGAQLKAAVVDTYSAVSGESVKITLVGSGKVVTQSELTAADFDTGDKQLDISDPDEEDYITYSIKQATGFAIIIAGVPTYYNSLQEAIDAYEGKGEVTLMDNAEIPALISITKNVTLNLNGFTLAREDDDAMLKSLFEISNEATLTVNANDGAAYGRLASVGKQITVGNGSNGKLIVNGGTYTAGATQTAIHVNGDCSACEVTINDATIVSTGDNGVQFNGKGTFAINRSSITGATAIYMKAGTLTIDDKSVITATAATWTAPVANHNGSNPTGDAIVMDSITGYKGEISLTVADGATVTSVAGATIRETITAGADSTTVKIDAPTIGGIALTPQFIAMVAAGTAQLPGYVAVIGTVPYKTLQAAITAAGAEATVKLIANAVENVTVAADKDITIDMNGKTLTNVRDYYTIDNYGALALVDSTYESGDPVGKVSYVEVVAGKTSSTVRNLGYLEIDDIEVYNQVFIAVKNDEGAGCNGGKGYGELVINGVKFTGFDQAIQNWGEAELNGGTYQKVFTWADPTNGGNVNGRTVINGGVFNDIVASVNTYDDGKGWPTDAQVTINGGTFNAKVYGTYTTNYKGEDPVRGKVTIVGEVEEGVLNDAQFIQDESVYCETGYETVKLEGDDYYTVAAIPQAEVAKIGTKTYPTLAAAFEDAKGVESVTIELLGDLAEDVTVTDVNATLDLGGFTLTGAMSVAGTLTIANGTNDFGSAGFQITGGKLTLAADGVLTGWKSSNEVITLTNGADFDIYGKILITTDGSNGGMAVVIMDDSDGSVVNAYAGCSIESGVTIFKSRCGDGKVGTINVYGGTFTQTNYGSMIYGSKSGPSVFNIVGGTFNMKNLGYMFSGMTGTNNTITVLDDTCTAKFSKDPSEGSKYAGKLIADGCGAVLGNDGYYMIKKVWDVTLINGAIQVDKQVVADGACATNVTLAVDGFKGWTNETYTAGFDFATPIDADLMLYAWIEDAQPVNPEEPKQYNTPEEAADAAKAINDNKEKMIITPSGAVAADYTKLFTAVVTADNRVVVELNADGTNTLAASAEKVVEKATGLGDSTETAVTITPSAEDIVPGFYYGLGASTEVAGEKIVTSWQQATTEGLKEPLTANKPENSTKGFFQVRVSVRQQN